MAVSKLGTEDTEGEGETRVCLVLILQSCGGADLYKRKNKEEGRGGVEGLFLIIYSL